VYGARRERRERSEGRPGRVQIVDLQLISASGQREYAIDIRGTAQEHESAAGPPSASAGVDDRVHTAAVDELELAQVEHNQSRLKPRLAQRSNKLRYRRHVQLTGYAHPGSVRTAARPRAHEPMRRGIRARDRVGDYQRLGHVDLRG
jgi:hypothetical protein